ncbi:MAG: CoA transferase [Gammaproteobacteria bacterium]|nr:CoA transferase [Gammaproteobacteria bacterium]
MSGPLDGTLVLDLSRVLAGPWAGQTLADLGARVIKVERPGRGDDTRSWGPPWLESGDGRESAYFLSANRGKESVAIDFKDARGQAILLELARKADILIENYKVGGLIAYGLDYESIRKINPAIVYCSISGFGQTGPYAKKPGYDFMIQAMSGLMSITGTEKPTKVGVAVSDLITGLYATTGILAAYTRARETGEGEFVDVSLLDSQLATLANQASNYLVSGESPGLSGNAHPNIVPYQVFETADEPIVVAVGNDAQFVSLCEVIICPGLGTDPRFALNSDRVENRQILVPLIAVELEKNSSRYWLAELEGRGIPSGPVNSIAEVFNDAHVLERDTVLQLNRADLGAVPSVRSPIRFQNLVPDEGRAPPALGDSTETILGEIGLDDQEIKELLSEGVVA